MKKCKMFYSFMKEREWLEEMAANGWLLTNISLGIIYEFKQVEPCKKVYEIERFSVSSQPSMQELTARKFAMDITAQSGWEVVTCDEDMNYYFVKDQAGDESDEFYYDEDSRKERAERYRRYYGYEQPKRLLKSLILSTVLYIVLILLLVAINANPLPLMGLYIFLTAFEVLVIFWSVKMSESMYEELKMSREQWNEYSALSESRKFKVVEELVTFLQEKNKSGLSIVDFKNGRYIFEKDSCKYNYFIDTKPSLKKRLKNQGISYKNDAKDWYSQGLKWYEISIEEAEKFGFKLVCAKGKDVLIYKRAFSEEAKPCENDNAKLKDITPVIILVLAVAASFLLGFMAAKVLIMLGL